MTRKQTFGILFQMLTQFLALTYDSNCLLAFPVFFFFFLNFMALFYDSNWEQIGAV